MTNQQEVILSVAEDRSAITIELPADRGQAGKLTLSPDQLLVLIQQLGETRAEMIAGQKYPSLSQTKIKYIVHPPWRVKPDALGEASALAFQHPAFGAVGFLMPIDQVAQMIRILTAQIERAGRMRTKAN